MDKVAYANLKKLLEARAAGESLSLDFERVDFSGASLSGFELSSANFKEATFSLASLVGANLAEANLAGAALHGADLGGADLTCANLSGADLSKAQLDDAVLTNADLRGAYIRDIRGEPLSMAGALLDRKAIDRSGLTDADLSAFVRRGVQIQEPDSLPPLSREVISLAPPSFISILRAEESASRRESASLNAGRMRTSSKMVNFLTQLVEDARLGDGMPTSLRLASLPQVSTEELREAVHPEVGLVFMGIQIEEELPGGSIARKFRGKNQDGEPVFVKVFDPLRPGAALQLPAFQRGLRSMNRALCRNDPSLHMMELLAVASDLTAYVARYHDGGSLEQLVSVDVSLETGLSIFEQLCSSFGVIHQSGALVRSIKPANILLEGLRPILTEIDMIDLPTMRLRSANGGGYIAFAAPEELLRTGTRSPTADVYTLGKLLQYLLLGQEPMDSLTGDSQLQTRSDVPPFLVQLIAHCTAQDPAQRFQETSEILAEVARFRAEGSSAQLKAPLRVRQLSRINPVPSLLPHEREAIFGQVQPLDDAEREDAPAAEGRWLDRRLEVGLGAIALMVAFFIAAAIWRMPKSVDFIESAWFVFCVTAGLSMWLLPRPRSRLPAFRMSCWAGLFSALFFLGPMPLARARWSHELASGDTLRKERAVANLIRSGARDFSNRNLRGLSLVGQDLSLAQFAGASLRSADLSHSLIRESDFENADLDAARVLGSDLRLSNLASAKSLVGVLCDEDTLFPPEMKCENGYAKRVEERPSGTGAGP